MGLTRPRKPKVATRSNVLDKQDMAKKRTKTISKTTTIAPMMLVRKEPAKVTIAARAYELFVARGGQHGDALTDWLAAEAELRG